MELWRPDWFKILPGYFRVGGLDARANELVSVTRETASLAAACLLAACEQSFSHPYYAAAKELKNALRDPDKPDIQATK